mgnify:CR=1 FL=1
MRILHVITDLNTGGAEKLMVDLLPRMNTSGCEVEICLFNGTSTPFLQQIKDAGIKIYIFGEKPNYYSPKYLWKLIKLAKRFNIVHTHNTSPQLFGAFASLWCKAKFCTTEHTTMSHHRVWWFEPMERWMYSRYAHVMCISEATLQNMRAVAGKKVPNATIIPNGIDLSIYKNTIPVDRSSINTYSNSKVLLMVGRYSYQKDQATIIKAMTLLPMNVELWLAGYGETHDKLLILAKSLGVADRVHLLGMRTDVPNLLRACDVVIQSSHIEGFGLAAVEGMAVGKPVVASEVQGLAQVVQGAGILFPHEDEKSLAEEVKHLLNDDVYYNKVANRCKERADEYDIQRMVDGYKDIYNSLLSCR